MTSPLLIDAEALAEFLDKAEPFLPGQLQSSYGRALRHRTDSLGRGIPDAMLWRLPPATRRRPQEASRAAGERAERILAAARTGDAAGVLGMVEDWSDRPPWAVDWATFWLHSHWPERCPWWARWVYRPGERTGALLLVLSDAEGGLGTNLRETYSAIGQAEEFLGAVLASTRRLRHVEEAFRPTLALAAIYAVYMFTMASWRMTEEFTQVLPRFEVVVAKLLGIDHRWEASRIGAEGQGG